MKKVTIIVIIAAIVIASGLASPLFYDTSVDESLPGMLNEVEEGLTVEKFIAMEGAEQQMVAEKMPDKVKDMIMQESAETTNVVSEDMEDPGLMILTTGTFEGLLGHDARGTAKILEVAGSQYLRFEDFEITNGPDLRVYLTNDGDVKAGHHLDKLKGNKGSQNYSLDGVDWEKYDTVVVYCQPFGVHFGQAALS